MKNLVMLLGFLLLISSTVWAQTDSAAAVRQRADESAAKAIQKLQLPALPSINLPVTPYSGLQGTPFRSDDPLTALQVAPGTWWNNADTAMRLSLTKDQQKKMDDIFQQFRLKLIDLNATLSKEELIMDPLIAAEKLDEVKVLAQIDRIAEARAELEKANARMLLAIRQSLTMDQWTKIQSMPINGYKAILRNGLNSTVK